MNYVLVSLLADRTKTGRLELISQESGEIRFRAPALGKGDNAAAAKAGNPSRNPLFRNGDTPTGLYVATYRSWWTATTPADIKSYGRAKIDLNPIQSSAEAGALNDCASKCASLYGFSQINKTQAATAERNGRSGLLVHGGAPGVGGILRPTNGCVRLANDDIGELVELIPGPTVLVVREA